MNKAKVLAIKQIVKSKQFVFITEKSTTLYSDMRGLDKVATAVSIQRLIDSLKDVLADLLKEKKSKRSK